MHVSRLILAAASILLCPLAALADTTYTYTGTNFLGTSTNDGGTSAYIASDSVSGYVTFATPLGDNSSSPVTILSYSFSDGVQTLTNANSTIGDEYFETNAAGYIDEWIFTIDSDSSHSDYISTSTFDESGYGDYAAITIGDTTSYAGTTNPGYWTETPITPTPEPSSIALLATGLLTAAGAIRRRIA